MGHFLPLPESGRLLEGGGLLTYGSALDLREFSSLSVSLQGAPGPLWWGSCRAVEGAGDSLVSHSKLWLLLLLSFPTRSLGATL